MVSLAAVYEEHFLDSAEWWYDDSQCHGSNEPDQVPKRCRRQENGQEHHPTIYELENSNRLK